MRKLALLTALSLGILGVSLTNATADPVIRAESYDWHYPVFGPVAPAAQAAPVTGDAALYAFLAAMWPTPVPDAHWDAIAQCETGGNWAMTGSRYSGGVGFANTTWNAWGGQLFAPNAGLATREQQIAIANRGYAMHGPSAWGCTAP